MTPTETREPSRPQLHRLYNKLRELCEAYIDKYGKETFRVRNKKLCVKADISYCTMNSISAWDMLDEFDGVNWMRNYGKLEVDPEKYLESYKTWSENHD